jgi:DNA-binding MarR family transcriptional regulator
MPRTTTPTHRDQLRPELPLARTIGYLSARVGQAFQRSLLIKLREAGFSITVEEWRLMRALWAEDGLPQARLGDIALKDKGQLSRMVSRLEAEGWVQRKADPSDRRTPRLFLTPTGRRLEAKLVPLGGAVRAQAVQGLDEATLAAAVRALEAMLSNLEPESTP